jgi:hypothetical protein
MNADDPCRFIVKMEVYAAAGRLDLSTEEANMASSLEEVLDALTVADPDDVEDQTYRSFRFDLCDPCRRRLLEKPLG